jgi:CCR4-NOT transcription complex subunit 4
MRTDNATFSAEEQASINVDALVNDTDTEVEPTRSIPSTPLSSHFFSQPRRATPTIPPGFSAPVIPRAMVEETKSRPGSRPMSRTTSSTITPAVPVVPVTPIRASTPVKGKKAKQPVDVIPAAATPGKPQPETPTKTTSKASAAKIPTAGGAANKSVDATPVQTKQSDKVEDKKPVPETPLRESVKGKGGKKTAAVTETTPQKKVTKAIKAETKDPISTPATTPVASTKRQPPGKLDITAATQTPATEQSPATSSQKTESLAKIVRATPVTSTTSVPASPAAAAATGSPIKRAVAPRTLRVVPTPKTEVPPPLSAASAPSLPQILNVDKLRSRQASIASVNLPGTPMSEMFSETASVTSASVSRASSPPPIGGKIGTAPVRKKTKSQAKKDRQERKKQIEEEMTIEENKSDVEVVQAPIIGRKKKEKKPAKTPKIPPKSQPASPKPAIVEEEHSDAPVPIPAARPAPSAKTSATATPDPEQFTETKERREHTAQSIMADLQKTGDLLASTLEFFKPLSSSLTHASRTTPASNLTGPPDLKIHFSEADLEAIAKKKPVRLNGHDDKPDSRTLITPSGKFFWGLSEELEEKALQLEKQIEELRGHARFHPRKQTGYPHTHNAGHAQSNDVLPAIATALKEAGKKLGNSNTQHMPKLDTQSILNEAAREAARQAERLPVTPLQPQQESQQPPPPQPQTPADAGAYLNQFVVPKTDNPPPNQPRPEMAAVGGSPGAGTANISVNVGKFAKAAKAVVEGGAVGSTEIDGMGMMAADLLGGVFVQGLEALVGAGLGFESSQEFGLDANGNITIGRGGAGVGGGLDMSGFMSAIEGFDGGRYGRGSVMSMEEAERAMHAARKEHEVLEKKLAGLMKKNKKLWGGVGKV